MPRVASFELPGIDCRFYSNDHEPPHFHARRKGEWEYRVYFLLRREQMLELKWGSGASAKDLNALCDAGEAHRAALMQEWNDKVQSDD